MREKYKFNISHRNNDESANLDFNAKIIKKKKKKKTIKYLELQR